MLPKVGALSRPEQKVNSQNYFSRMIFAGGCLSGIKPAQTLAWSRAGRDLGVAVA
jgi:hypothetical protein